MKDGLTQQELDDLPEIKNVSLWQERDQPTMVKDQSGVIWFIGIHDGKRCKRRFGYWNDLVIDEGK